MLSHTAELIGKGSYMSLLLGLDGLSKVRTRLNGLLAAISGADGLDGDTKDGILDIVDDIQRELATATGNIHAVFKVADNNVARVTRYDTEPGRLDGPRTLRDNLSTYDLTPGVNLENPLPGVTTKPD